MSCLIFLAVLFPVLFFVDGILASMGYNTNDSSVQIARYVLSIGITLIVYIFYSNKKAAKK